MNGFHVNFRVPIFRKIMRPLMALITVEIIILVSTMYGSGLASTLHTNARELVNNTSRARQDQLQTIMLNQWMNLDDTVRDINNTLTVLLEEGDVALAELDLDTDQGTVFLSEITSYLISLLKNNHVTGSYLVLNSQDLSKDREAGTYRDLQGIYLRNPDPNLHSSDPTVEILLERSPEQISRTFRLARAAGWTSGFAFGTKGLDYYDFLYEPTQAVLKRGVPVDWRTYGYWGAPFALDGQSLTAVTYSVPLLYKDTLYGVLGIDITLEHLWTQLPYLELDTGGTGIYYLESESVILETPKEDGSDRTSTKVLLLADADSCRQALYRDVVWNSSRYYRYPETMVLDIMADDNPYGRLTWALGSAVLQSSMDSFANRLIFMTGCAILLTLLVGMIGSVLVSRSLERPIKRIADDLSNQELDKPLSLSSTGIEEIDRISDALEDLNQRLIAEHTQLVYERDHDFLTKLYNRGAFERCFKQYLLDDNGTGIGAYLMIDLDYMKQINDHYGHEYGDRYLQCAANAMRTALREEDLYCRTSGDEFNIFIYDAEGDRLKVEQILSLLKKSLTEAYIRLPDSSIRPLLYSIGVSWYPEDGKAHHPLQKKADDAMYEMKKKSHTKR